MDGEYKFKLSLTGFNRSDVLEYIAKLRREYHDYRVESERTIGELEKRCEQLEKERTRVILASEQTEPVLDESCADAETEENSIVDDARTSVDASGSANENGEETVNSTDSYLCETVEEDEQKDNSAVFDADEKTEETETPSERGTDAEAEKRSGTAYADGYDFSRAMDMLIAEYGE